MASSAPATLLDSLPPRPPTPPREAGNEAELSVKSLLGRAGSLDPRLSLQTPPSASQASSAATNSNPSSSRTRKKVEWSRHTEYKEPPNYAAASQLSKSSPASAPSSAPSSASSRPVKGILKQTSSPNPLASSLSSELNGPANQINITEMLDSTIKQLAGPDRDSRLDAYMMLARALKASRNLPDRVALQDKMSLFMQFIQRDITSRNPAGGPDNSLINQALNLLATFLHFPAIASTLTSEFGVFLVDHSIRCFEDVSTPKDVARHCMQVIAFQNFSPKVMTSDRVGRLVAALHNIEDHLMGKSIVMSRIQIYKRLIKQSRMHMATHSDWLKDMFSDMLSTSIKEIQAQAIALGKEAGFALRSEMSLLRKAKDILQTTDENGRAYIEFYIDKLNELIKDKQYSSAVPEIWGVVILFMRCPLEKWTYYSPWLTLIQSAFNKNDLHTKLEANHAWNRYVYLSLTDAMVTPKLLQTLCMPLLSQLRRKLNGRQLEEGVKRRRALVGGACNLYYYALRPGNSKSSSDMVWEFAIQPVMSQLISSEGTGENPTDCLTQACRVLVGLLDASTPRVWREDRIMDLPPVKPDELPAMDSKWIRRNCDKVFRLAGPLLENRFTDLANKESLTYRLWQALVGSVTAASAKDIKVSEDTAKFFACTFGLLSTVWSQGCPESDGSLNAKFLPSVRNFVGLLVDGLGMLPFTEKKLSMTVANTFEPVATPSHRPDRPEKPRGLVRIPLHHLFSMLSSIPSGGADNEDFSEFLQSVFEPFLNGKAARSRGELVRELLQLLPRNTLAPFAPWVMAARSSISTLERGPVSITSSAGNDKILGPEYRETVSLLERGLTSHPNLPSHHWFALFDSISNHVGQEFGDAGRAIILIEPISKVLLDSFTSSEKPPTRSLDVAVALFKAAKMPRDRQALEVARRRLWGAPSSVGRGGPDPFDNLYKLGNTGLRILYDTLDELNSSADATPLFESVSGFLVKSYSQNLIGILSKTQAGVSPWIQDDRAQLHLSDETALSQAIRHLWDRICADLVGLGRLDKGQLDQIEPLLTAGFKSKHRSIVNQAADTWNKLIKDEDHVDCSDSFMSVLSSLRSKVDLVLPGVEQSSGDFGAQATSFIESQDPVSFAVLSSTSSNRDAQRPLAPVAANSLATSRSSRSKKRRRDATPEVTHAKPSKWTSTPRLRHDNSQIQFAPIASSSPLVEESQQLTERQRDVRERQRENAALYSDVRTSSPAHADRQTSPTGPRASPTSNEEVQPKATPERPASYEDLISSTPTPRRGQVFQIDDYNDPPSSPPEPRPYPLLSEIQSRSRASSSLDNWEFSSPPGSPVTSRQQVAHDAEPPHLTLTGDSTQNRPALSANTQGGAKANAASSLEVIPSSLVAGERSDVVGIGGDMAIGAQELPSTPPQRSTTRPHETPKSGDEEFVDARSSPLERRKAATNGVSSQAKDKSDFGNWVVSLESRRPSGYMSVDDTSPDKQKKTTDAVHECIIVSSSPPRRSKRSSKRSASPMIPSTPAELATGGTATEPKGGKRKRKSRQSDGRPNKRRSIEPDEADRADHGSQSSSPAMRMPQRCLGLKSRRSERRTMAEASPQSAGHAASDDQLGDTDEELMSQLVTESNAASQSQSPLVDEGFAEEKPAEVADSMDTGSINDKVAGESMAKMEPPAGDDDSGDASIDADQDKDGAAAIMDRLRGGLEGLRQASLSRDEVYKIEDLLMDMKRELFEAERRGRKSVE